MGRSIATQSVRSQDTSRRDPFAPAVAGLQSILDDAVLATRPGQAFVDFSPESRRALDALEARAGQPSVGSSAADFGRSVFSGAAPATSLGALTETARGDFLGLNPLLGQSLDAESEDIEQSVLGRFSAAGRLPARQSRSGPNTAVVRALGRELARQRLPVVADQFNRERSNQLDAARSLFDQTIRLSQLAPTLDQASLFGPELLLRVGNLREERERDRLLEPLQQLQRRGDLIRPVAALGGTTTRSGLTGRRTQTGRDPLTTALAVLGAGQRAGLFG